MRCAPTTKVVSVLAICAVVFTSCRSPDAIDRLVDKISATDPESRRTHFGPVHLPATASVEEVVRSSMGVVVIRKTLAVREVHIRLATRPMTAVLLDTRDEGQKIVLLFYMGDRGWLTQVYDAN